jgi:hypothetical protein
MLICNVNQFISCCYCLHIWYDLFFSNYQAFVTYRLCSWSLRIGFSPRGRLKLCSR